MKDSVRTCVMLPGRAEEAVDLYCRVVPGSRRIRVVRGGPGGPDAVLTIEFELAGRPFLALNAGPASGESMRLSLSLGCPDQAAIDRAWDLLGEGGSPGPCGWVTDRFGVPWQVVPERLGDLLADPGRGPRAFQRMLTMGKLDIAALEAA
jgi:predicted 3-demethylubiquinone-9 3-methyltransferase (glyoxalase superfamily)